MQHSQNETPGNGGGLVPVFVTNFPRMVAGRLLCLLSVPYYAH